MDRLAAGEVFIATLAGARIEASTTGVGIFREAGELSRRGFEPLPLPQNRTVVFDGRFELTATAPDLVALALRGNAARLPEDQRRALKSLPAAARTGLPVVTDGGALWTCPILAVSPFVRAQALVQTRFDAALGRIAGEANAQSVAEHGEAAGGDLS